MTAHTPSPWNIIPEPEPYAPIEIRNGFHPICKLWMDDAPVHEFNAEQRANARLISAAPDLLAALINVRKLISEAAMTGFNCRDGDWAERLFASQQVSSDAIKKATGTELLPLAPAGIDTREDKIRSL